MTVYESTEPQQLVDVVPTQGDYSDEAYPTGRKTRRSRRGGYRRKRQHQRQVAAMMAESAARRSRGETIPEFKPPATTDSCDSSTATTEAESSSSESTHGDDSSSPVARKRNNNKEAVKKQEQTPCYHYLNRPRRARFPLQYQNKPVYYQQPAENYYAAQYPHPAVNPAMQQFTAPAPYRKPVAPQFIAPGPNKVKIGGKFYNQKRQEERYVAMDCEMVGVGELGDHSVLARVTIVDWNGDVLMDELIKPQWEVTDYRTFVSGITKEMLDNATMDFASCRSQVMKLLHRKIVVGHGLKSDLAVLGIVLPWYMIRDTAKYEPFMKVRFQDGVLWPRGLKDLCKEQLNRDVQVYGRPHCPKEDAVAALDLYKLVAVQFEQSMEYKWNRTVAMQHQRAAVGVM